MIARGFRSIIGHKDVIRHLQTAAASGRVGHAYLITGDEGSGKTMVAEAFAEALLCDRAAEGAKTPEEYDACLACTSCKKAMSDNHPDIFHVSHEKPNVITVGEIRQQVVWNVEIRPYESSRKIYIIPDAEKMNEQAQNALLKTIEEPPEYVLLLLLCSSPQSLLPTIRSRCVELNLHPLPDREIMEYLTGELHLPDYEARILTSFSQGNLGKAIYAAEDETFAERKQKTLTLVRNLHSLDTASVMEAVKLIKEDRAKVDEILDLLLMWYRDVLLYKATREIDQLIFSDEIMLIRSQAKAASYEGLQEILAAIDRCRVRLRANVNFELALELLLECIKENCNA